MEENFSNFFESVECEDYPNKDTKAYSNSNAMDNSNNNFEVPLPLMHIKDIISNSAHINEVLNDIEKYEQYPNTTNTNTTIDTLTSTDYSKVIPEQNALIQINILEHLLTEDKENPVILYKLIELYKTTNQRDKLNSIREQTLKLYPLPEAIWIDWIKDNRSQCLTIQDQYQLIKLYQTALSDFPYLNLSLIYIEHLIALSKEDNDTITPEYVRAQFKEVIRVWGLDIDRSTIVYDMYISFESKHNCSITAMRSIWRERLRIPQTTIDAIWDEYANWDKANISEVNQSRLIYESTSNKVNYVITVSERYKALINDITNENFDLNAFVSFINAELPELIKLNKDYVLLFFERALEVNWIQTEIWKLYLSYISSLSLDIGCNDNRKIKLNILRRACRCCPGDTMLVILYLRELEINGDSNKKEDIEKKIIESFSLNESLLYQYEIWKYYLEYKCRTIDLSAIDNSKPLIEIRKLFSKAINFVKDQSEFIDNLYHIWAEFECYKTKDVNMLIDIMNHIVTKDEQSLSSIHNWRAFIYYIKSVGNEQMIREVYRRSFDNCIEEREMLKNNWIAWEKVFGTPQSIDSTVSYTQRILNKDLELFDNNNNNNIGHTTHSITNSTPLIIEPEEEDKSNRKIFMKNLPSEYNETELKQFIVKHSPFASIREIRVIRDDNGKSRHFAFIDMNSTQDALALVNDLNNKPIDDKHIVTCAISKPPKEGENDTRTLFINNLAYSTTKEQLNQVFSQYGPILDIRLIINQQTNKPRGYGYIEYQSEESIEAALSDTKPIVIDGRRIKVQKSQSVGKVRSMIKYVAIVTNLPYKVKEKELLEFILTNDKDIDKESIIGVKIAKDDKGESKGFGFVEFNSIIALNKAIGLSGRQLGNRAISIKEANNDKSQLKRNKERDQGNNKEEQFLSKKKERSKDSVTLEEEVDNDQTKPKPKKTNKDFSKLFN